jgi:hypothetical protein
MNEPASAVNSTKLAAELASMNRAELATALRHDLTSYNGPSICYGIMYAGAAYPIVVAVISIAFIVAQIVASLNQMTPPRNLVELAIIPFFLVGYAALGSMLGIVWAGVLSMITLPVVYLFVRSLKLRGSLIWLGAVSGGLVGFVASLPVTLSLPWALGRGAAFGEIFIALALGPALATVLGQLGGAWGGWRAYKSSEQFYGITTAAASDHTAQRNGDQRPHDIDKTAASPADRRLQFGLRHMMWLMVWISLLLCIIRLSGIAFEYVLPLTAGWTVYQWITLRVGERLLKSLGPKWVAWRSLRST